MITKSYFPVGNLLFYFLIFRAIADVESEISQEISEIVGKYTVSHGNDTDYTPDETEGTFKANEVDVVYVTAPNGFKVNLRFVI